MHNKMLVKQNKKNAGVAHPLRFFSVYMWRWRDMRSLYRIAFFVVSSGWLFSWDRLRPLTNIFRRILLDSIWMRAESSSDRASCSRHRISVFSVNPSLPILIILSNHKSAESLISGIIVDLPRENYTTSRPYYRSKPFLAERGHYSSFQFAN